MILRSSDQKLILPGSHEDAGRVSLLTPWHHLRLRPHVFQSLAYGFVLLPQQSITLWGTGPRGQLLTFPPDTFILHRMIRYHGGPITPESAAMAAWRGSHAMISFANPEQTELAFAVADSVAFDNGAWPIFAAGKGRIDILAYRDWVKTWYRHPSFDWCLIPDIIDGSEEDNNSLIRAWELDRAISVPVWHMHESLDKLRHLIGNWPRVAIGSSGDFITIGTPRWWGRISEAMEIACDNGGHPLAKLHGLRQMDPEIFSVVPYSSVDSTNVARNIGIDSAWTGSYVPRRKETRAMVLRSNIEHHASSARWPGYIPRNMELFG